MLNKGTLFSGKRPDAAPQQNGLRPIAPATMPASPVASAPDIPLPAIKEAPAPVVAASATHQGAKLVVGPGVKLKGAEIQDCDSLVVEGRVEATMDSRLIQIADQGSFDGKVNIDVAEIHGRFRGEMTAREQIIIHATGHVSGKIRYGKIIVHEGGELSGDVRSLTAEVAMPANEPVDLDSAGLDKILAARTG
jgi:cytoskeletal protein CcmA (bactofilin family)